MSMVYHDAHVPEETATRGITSFFTSSVRLRGKENF